MKQPRLPPDESERQAALDRLQIVDTPAEERFDRLTRLASRAFAVPIALITLLDRDRQWFKSAHGLDLQETPRAISFCDHAIRGADPLVVSDAAKDPRFGDNPLVRGVPGIRFYAGQPIRGPEGHRVGTLCLIDRRPRRLDRAGRRALSDLAKLVERELEVASLSESERELRSRLAAAELRIAVDGLTRTWSREMIVKLSSREMARTERSRAPLCLAIADIDDFKKVNDSHGHAVGDEVLRECAMRLRQELRTYDAVGRYGGEEFVLLLPACDADTAAQVLERVRVRISEAPIETSGGPVRVTCSFGVALYDGTESSDSALLLKRADAALYRAKGSGKNRVEMG
jgi:diguanylate cyclase (GGDEF)-like protein